MLYLASLNAPHIGTVIKIAIPTIPFGPIKLRLKHAYINSEGATPKETKSERESSSFPNSLETLRNLAILPSYLSTKPANSINTLDKIKFFSDVNNNEITPQDKFIKVKMLGIQLFSYNPLLKTNKNNFKLIVYHYIIK